MLTKDGKNVSLDDITAENYLCPKGEERSFHAIIEVKQFNAKTGARISSPALQKFGAKTWESKAGWRALRRQGYDIRVVHDPTEWIKAQREQAAKVAEARKQQAEAKRKAEFDAVKEQAKAELLAELQAQGLVDTTTKRGRKTE